jgi:hypothetical protein
MGIAGLIPILPGQVISGEWASAVPCPAGDLPTRPGLELPEAREPVINVNRKRLKDFSTMCLHWPACLLV